MKNKIKDAITHGFCFITHSLKMKLTYVFLCIITVQVNAGIYSQNSILTLNIENESIAKVFDYIEDVSGYNFLYNNSYINLDRKVSVIVEKERIDRIVYRLFKNTNVDFVILDKQIILKSKKKETNKKRAKPFLKTQIDSILKNTTQKITGHVIDENDMPFPLVTILVKGTQRGTETDFDGNYTIEVESGETLVFTFLGFMTTEVLVKEGQTEYNVKMIPTSIQLDAIEIVSTGYELLPKDRATGSFVNVSRELLKKKTVVNVLDQLNGEVTGVLFNPNDNDNPVVIRGISTINSNRSPLIVVDGFPIQGDLKTINPNTIESLTVLKDAAAASIWGIRATNGVIVVETKKGSKTSKPKIDASFNSFYSPKANLKTNNLASPSTQIDYSLAYFGNDLSFTTDTFDSDDTSLFGGTTPQITPLAHILTKLNEGKITQQEADSRINALRTKDIRDEYSRLFLRPQLKTQYSVMASGANEKTDYSASLLYHRNEGSFVNETSDQLLASIANKVNLSNKLHLKTSINASFNKDNLAPDDGASFSIASYAQGDRYISPENFITNYPFSGEILNTNGQYSAMLGGSGIGASEFLVDKGLLPFTYNLKEEFDHNNNTTNEVDLRIQTSLSYDIIEGLTLDALYQFESTRGSGQNILNENRYWNRAMYNYYARTTSVEDLDNFQLLEEPIKRGSVANFSENNARAHTFRTQLNFNTSFNDALHKLTALTGYEVRKTIVEQRENIRFGYSEQSLTYTNPDYITQFEIPLYFEEFRTFIEDPSTYIFNENRFLSYYANAAYTYNNKYTFTTSIRLDDTNLFGQSNDYRNIPLYSFGLKWDIDKAHFFNSETVTDLSFRVTYGTNGNVNLQTSPFLQIGIDNSTNEDLPNIPYGFVKTVPNPKLRLERTKTLNLGLDITLFDGVISSTIEYYQKNSEDLLVSQLLNSTLGITESLLNIGELKNEGVDIGLNLNLFQETNFKYATRFNFSYNKNKVTALNNDRGTNIEGLILGNVALIDKPLFTIHSFNYAGLDREGNPQFFDENNAIVDYNTEVNSADALISEGTLIAPYYGSWMNNFEYKNWSLRVLGSFQAGHVFRFGDVYNPGSFNEVTTFKDFEHRWQKPGDEAITDVPALISNFDDKFAPAYGFNEATSQYLSSDKFVDSAANIILQEIILSYQFNNSALESFGMDDFTLSFQGNNLNVWNFNKWDVDPNNTLIPLIPTYSFSIRTSF